MAAQMRNFLDQTAEEEDLPLSKEASRYYKSGDPFLQRYLRFWLAVVAGRVLLLLIRLIGVAYPLLRVTPALYGSTGSKRMLIICTCRAHSPLCFIRYASMLAWSAPAWR
jgi:hypothetical protein